MLDAFPGELRLSQGDAPYDIHLSAKNVGFDILVSVSGGTHAHIGAVALAEPADAAHPVTGEAKGETKGDGSCVLETKGATKGAPRVSVLTAYGHKDSVLAEMFASGLCEKYGVNVCVSAGVHVDGASAEEIALMLKNAEGLLAELLSL